MNNAFFKTSRHGLIPCRILGRSQVKIDYAKDVFCLVVELGEVPEGGMYEKGEVVYLWAHACVLDTDPPVNPDPALYQPIFK